jgi:hypothetical protein
MTNNLTNAYDNPSPARTELIQIPYEDEDNRPPTLPFDPRDTDNSQFAAETYLKLSARYRYSNDPNPNSMTPTEFLVVLVTETGPSASGPFTDIPDVWVSAEHNLQGVSGNCDALPINNGGSNWPDRHTLREELRLYKVEFDEEGQPWTDHELQEILDGVTQIGLAFSQITGGIAPTAFQNDMLPGLMPYILFRRTNADDNECITLEGDASRNDKPSQVTCAGILANGKALDQGDIVGEITAHTVVHELGHLFDYHKNDALKNAVNQIPNITMPGSFHEGQTAQGNNWNGALRACGWQLTPDRTAYVTDQLGNRQLAPNPASVKIIMGASVSYPNDVIRYNEWSRGLAGWGTYSQEGQANLTLFQQNPDNIDIEAAADMFLNWVYRRNTDLPPSGDPCTYVPTDTTWQGFQNIDFNGNPDLQLSGNVRYWWMDQVMLGILQ